MLMYTDPRGPVDIPFFALTDLTGKMSTMGSEDSQLRMALIIVSTQSPFLKSIPNKSRLIRHGRLQIPFSGRITDTSSSEPMKEEPDNRLDSLIPCPVVRAKHSSTLSNGPPSKNGVREKLVSSELVIMREVNGASPHVVQRA